MKTSSIIGAVIVVVIIIAGAVLYMNTLGMSPAYSQTQAQTTNTSGQTSSTSAAGVGASASVSAGTPAPQSFTVNGNDETADLKTIMVPVGTPVTITFGADQGTTYHGGLDFRSSVVNTGTITPGSTKTVSFIATKSFSFTPYWPSTNIAKPYTIDIVVH